MPVELLDYPKANIRIMVETPWERQWRSKSASKEPETTAWIDEHVQEGDVFWDIGACVGTYGLMAASRGAKVLCVEPEQSNFSRLHENRMLNPDLDLEIGMLAISDVPGDGFLSVTHGQPGAANNHISGEGQRIEIWRLSSLLKLYPQPDHIKIDVDGHEVQVVRGGVETLQACKTVMCEINHDIEGAEDEIRSVFDGFTETVHHRSANTFNHLFVRSTD